MAKVKQSGSAVVIAIVTVVMLIVVGLVAWRVYDSTQQADKSLSNAEASSNTEPIKSDDKKEVTTKKIVIPYIDYEIEVPDSIKDLTFYRRSDGPGGSIMVQVSTKTLTAIDPNCAADKYSALGFLEKRTGQYKDIPDDQFPGRLVKQEQDYFIDYYPRQAACSESGITEQDNTISAFNKALGF